MEIINDYSQLFDLIYKIIMIFIFGFGLYSIIFQKKGLQYSTIKDCIDIHRNILRSQQKLKANSNTKPEKHLILIRDHLGLVTDELFYMKNGYLPENISKTWIKNMINFIPIQCKGEIINKTEILTSREISDYINLDYKNKNLQSIYFKKYISLIQEGEVFSKIRNTFTLEDKMCVNMTVSLQTTKKEELVNHLWNIIVDKKKGIKIRSIHK